MEYGESTAAIIVTAINAMENWARTGILHLKAVSMEFKIPACEVVFILSCLQKNAYILEGVFRGGAGGCGPTLRPKICFSSCTVGLVR